MGERRLAAGQGSLAGLRWLSAVGGSSLEAWGVAMGWGRSAVYSHAVRLQAKGWVARCSMAHGDGSLVYATREGVRVARVNATVLARAPAPVAWAHLDACAWTAAWLTARGREMLGPRELLADRAWRGQLEWFEWGAVRRRGHRPDLAGRVVAGGPLIAIEVELTSKSLPRLRAVLGLHASWVASGKTPAVIYICADEKVADDVRAHASEVGLTVGARTLRIELLDTIRRHACAARAASSRALPGVLR